MRVLSLFIGYIVYSMCDRKHRLIWLQYLLINKARHLFSPPSVLMFLKHRDRRLERNSVRPKSKK